MVQILFTVFGMGHIYENAKIIDNHGTLLHTTVVYLLNLIVSQWSFDCLKDVSIYFILLLCKNISFNTLHYLRLLAPL